MKLKDRRKAYNEYLNIIKGGSLTEKSIELLNNAFNVTTDDIDEDVNDLIKSPESTPMSAQAAKFRILMEDLRDYRDSNEIKKTRRDVIKGIYNDDSIYVNEKYIFPI